MVIFAPDPGPTPDADLVEAVNRGSIDAFGELYARYRDWAFRLAHRFAGNEQDALRVLHDAFACLLRKAPRLELHAKLTTFLYPVVKNLAKTRQSQNGRATPGDPIDSTLGQVAAYGGVSPESAKADLAAALSALPEAQREVLLMRCVDDMPLADIVEVLAIPLGTVRSHLHGALNSLRDDPRTRSYFEP
ncbi:MAG: RNA polymerase sigma factor [Phycisphaerae bacterium]|nr:RNA polymerase sigma factor [Phycisphaerae bacterium]